MLEKLLRAIWKHEYDERLRKDMIRLYNLGMYNSEKWHLDRIANAEKDRDAAEAKLKELLNPQEVLKNKLSQVQEEIEKLIKERDEIYGKNN